MGYIIFVTGQFGTDFSLQGQISIFHTYNNMIRNTVIWIINSPKIPFSKVDHEAKETISTVLSIYRLRVVIIHKQTYKSLCFIN